MSVYIVYVCGGYYGSYLAGYVVYKVDTCAEFMFGNMKLYLHGTGTSNCKNKTKQKYMVIVPCVFSVFPSVYHDPVIFAHKNLIYIRWHHHSVGVTQGLVSLTDDWKQNWS